MCLHPSIATALRGSLNFSGYVISDEGAITFAGPGYHDYTGVAFCTECSSSRAFISCANLLRYVGSVRDAACLAMNAGTDLALGGEYATTLQSCLDGGNVTAARVDEALRRVLSAQFNVGWFDTLAAMAQVGMTASVARVCVCTQFCLCACVQCRRRAMSRHAGFAGSRNCVQQRVCGRKRVKRWSSGAVARCRARVVCASQKFRRGTSAR